MPAEHRKGRRSDREYSLHPDTCELIRITLAYPRERLFPFPFNRRQIWIHLHKILHLANLPTGWRFGFHCLRRTTESYAANAKGIEWAADAIGHSVEVARRSYISPAIVVQHRLCDAIPRPFSVESKQEVESVMIPSVPKVAKRMELDARRKAGQTLGVMKERGELDAGQGGDRKSRSQAATVKTLDDLDLTKSESSRYQAEAAVPIAIPDVAVPLVLSGENARANPGSASSPDPAIAVALAGTGGPGRKAAASTTAPKGDDGHGGTSSSETAAVHPRCFRRYRTEAARIAGTGDSAGNLAIRGDATRVLPYEPEGTP